MMMTMMRLLNQSMNRPVRRSRRRNWQHIRKPTFNSSRSFRCAIFFYQHQNNILLEFNWHPRRTSREMSRGQAITPILTLSVKEPFRLVELAADHTPPHYQYGRASSLVDNTHPFLQCTETSRWRPGQSSTMVALGDPTGLTCIRLVCPAKDASLGAGHETRQSPV
jgi:hypothetical protein